MAKQIIILERTDEPSDMNFNVVFWLSVPASRQAFYADVNKVSKYKDVSAQELQDIKDGKVLEVEHKVSYLAGTPIASVRNDLVTRFNSAQAEFNARNPWVRYGTNFDGTAWTNITIA